MKRTLASSASAMLVSVHMHRRDLVLTTDFLYLASTRTVTECDLAQIPVSISLY